MELKVEDIRVSSVRSYYGPGGMHYEFSGVNLHHRPTGISVTETSDRSQHRNKARAFERLEKLVSRAKIKPTPRPIMIRPPSNILRPGTYKAIVEYDEEGFLRLQVLGKYHA